MKTPRCFDRSGKVIASDIKHTGEEVMWTGWETWSTADFYKRFTRALYFYNYYLDSTSLKPFVLEWMKENKYSKEDICMIKDAPPHALPSTVGKMVLMLKRGMPDIHPRAAEHFAAMPDREDGSRPRGVKASRIIKSEIGKCLSRLNADRSDAADSGNAAAAKPKRSPYDLLMDKVHSQVIVHLEELLDVWALYNKDTKPPAVKSLNLTALLKSAKIPIAALGPIKTWVNRMHAEYEGAYEKTCEQLQEGYSYLPRPVHRKIMQALAEMQNELVSYSRAKVSERKPRIKKAKSAEKQVGRIKYQQSSKDYDINSISPLRIPGAQRLYTFNTKNRQLCIYNARNHDGLRVQGSSIRDYDEGNSSAITLRKPIGILRDILEKTPKRLDGVIADVKATRKKVNGRVNENILLLRACADRI